jgi:hypothetical protein
VVIVLSIPFSFWSLTTDRKAVQGKVISDRHDGACLAYVGDVDHELRVSEQERDVINEKRDPDGRIQRQLQLLTSIGMSHAHCLSILSNIKRVIVLLKKHKKKKITKTLAPTCTHGSCLHSSDSRASPRFTIFTNATRRACGICYGTCQQFSWAVQTEKSYLQQTFASVFVKLASPSVDVRRNN